MVCHVFRHTTVKNSNNLALSTEVQLQWTTLIEMHALNKEDTSMDMCPCVCL